MLFVSVLKKIKVTKDLSEVHKEAIKKIIQREDILEYEILKFILKVKCSLSSSLPRPELQG